MAFNVQQLSDMEEIRILKHRYFRGIDTLNLDLLAGLFTQDIKVEYNGGQYKVKFEGHAQMMEFLANSFHSGAVAMHHGHMPEITITGDNTAKGIWYLEDVFINLEDDLHTFGTAIYTDTYRREGGVWKIATTHYDRVVEVITPFKATGGKVTVQRLANIGRKPEERSDISHLITWSK